MSAAPVSIEKLAAALWGMERFQEFGNDMPAFSSYLDRGQEGCPLNEQSKAFQAYWKRRARRVLRAVRRATVK